ncbi:hypothetical protein ACOMHN_049636 [Nucella lapillus]
MESVTIRAARRPSRSRVNPSFSGSLPGFPEMAEGWLEDEADAVPLPDHFPDPCLDPGQEVKESRSSVTLEKGATLMFCPPQSAVTATEPVVTSAKPAVTPAVTSAQPAVTLAKPAVTSAKQPAVTSCPRPTLVIPKPLVTSAKPSPPPTSPKPVVTSPKQPPLTSPKPVLTPGVNPLFRSPGGVGREGQSEAKEGVKRITGRYAAPATVLRTVSGCSTNSQPSASDPKDTLHTSPTPSITLTPSPSFSFPQNTTAPVNNGTAPENDATASVSNVATPVNNGTTLVNIAVKRVNSSKAPVNNATAAINKAEAPDSMDVASTASTISAAPSLDSNLLRLPLVRGRGSGHSLSSASVSAFSDMSSEMSESASGPILRNSVFTGSMSRESGLVGTCRFQSVSGIPLTASLGDGVTDQDVQQVEMFYRSQKSEVTVCRCLANLYLGSAASKSSSASIPTPMNGSVSSSKYSDLWEFVTTGIPLVVQDSREHRRNQQVMMVLAEKGTGFVLWKDAVTSASHYSCPDSNFHTLGLSTDAKKLVGLSFDDSKAAAEFGACLTRLICQMDDDSGTLTRKGKRKKRQDSQRKAKRKQPKKTDISQPCCFQHITKLERPQITGVMPLPPNSFLPGSSVSGLSEIMRDRLSVSSRTHSYSSDLSEACTVASER